MPKMKIAVVPKPGANFEIQERDIPTPGQARCASTSLIDGLGPNGKLLVIGASGDPLEALSNKMLGSTKGIQGWVSGTAADSKTLCASRSTPACDP
jgi:hypothetical protein